MTIGVPALGFMGNCFSGLAQKLIRIGRDIPPRLPTLGAVNHVVSRMPVRKVPIQHEVQGLVTTAHPGRLFRTARLATLTLAQR
jgi:hypothetical protein